MNWIKKTLKNFGQDIKDTNEALESLKEPSTPTPEPEEEWIWVEGYKGTNANMQCRNDYQYELGVQYDMPDGEQIKVCEGGFHLCLSLQDVYSYYAIGGGCRFFKVMALVRKSDVSNYGQMEFIDCCGVKYGTGRIVNKLAAKSIIFTSELTQDEILKETDAENLPEDYKKRAIEVSVLFALETYHINTLVEDGYSMPFATYINRIGKFDVAHAFGSQKKLSMDMKVLGILYNTQGV